MFIYVAATYELKTLQLITIICNFITNHIVVGAL